jgi:hypothetical protein
MSDFYNGYYGKDVVYTHNPNNFGITNTYINANKAYNDSFQLGYNNVNIRSVTFDGTMVGEWIDVYEVPKGRTYTFIGVSYKGVDEFTELEFSFPNAGPSADITAPFIYNSVAGLVNEGMVKVMLNQSTNETVVTINFCILTNTN